MLPDNSNILHGFSKDISYLQKQTGLNKEDAELFFIYSIHGSFAINKKFNFTKSESQYHDLELLNRFTCASYEVFKNK